MIRMSGEAAREFSDSDMGPELGPVVPKSPSSNTPSVRREGRSVLKACALTGKLIAC